MANTMRRLLVRIRGAPRTLALLAKIEWAQLRTRGPRGYLGFRWRVLRNRWSDRYPTALQIEPYGGCNIRCAMCFQGRMGLPGDANLMPLPLFRAIVDELSPVTPMLYLFWRGEPMVHNGLGEMIRHAKRRGMYVSVSTNATLLTRERADELISAGLDFLIVGFDGATAESYESMRRGARFEAVSRQVRELVALRRERRAHLPHVCLQFIVSSVNQHELSMFRRLARTLGADSCIEKVLDTYENFHNPKIRRALAPLFVDGPWSKYGRRDDTLRMERRVPTCEMARRMVVRADGELSLCCYDMQGAYPIGLATGAPGELLRLWQRPDVVDQRRAGQRRELPLCIDCGAGLQR